MVNRYLFLLLLSLGLLWTSNAVAQNVPQGFNYQCIVRDNTGAPINNQTVTLLFTIRNNAPNGPIAYSEMQTVSTNGFGLINLTIGSGTPLQGNFANINWAVGTKFLTVSIETAPGVFDEIGTSQLLSVPYALYALQAANGNDNWGTQTVQTTPVLSGNGTASNPLTLAQQGAQPGQVLKWNGTAWVPQNDETGQSGTVTQVNTGDGLTGGPITTSGTISLANAPVTPGQYGDSGNIPVITVDQYGRVVNATAVPVILTTISAGAGISVTQNGQNFVVTNIGDVNPADDLTTSSTADGEITGPFSNLQIKPGVVTTAKLADGAVTTAKVADGAISSAKIVDGAVNTSKIANGAVVGAKISDMGASVGQVLKWNGATWAPAQDAVGQPVTLGAGMGINVSGSFPNFTITNTGDTDPNDDITATSIADGDITGPFVNLQIKPGAVNALKLANNAVTTLKINTHAVTGEKIDPMGATLGQVLKWNGTTWAPAPDNVGSVTISGGLGIDVVANGQNFLISNTGDVNPFDDVTLSSVAGGDLTGTFNDLQLKAGVVGSIELASNAVQTSKIQNGAVTGEKIAQMAATSGQVLKWNGTTWAPADDVGPDNWGSQTVIVSARLSGNGTGTSPLDIAQMGAAPGQVLKWNGFVWAPANDAGGNNYFAGAGISITGTAPNFTIINTGDTDPNDDLTTSSVANGDLTGTFNNLQLKAGVVGSIELADNAVETSKIQNGAVTGEKIAQMAATPGQVLKWNGTTWAPADATLYTSLNLIGDGSANNPLRLNSFSATDGQVLAWNSGANLWLPVDDSWGTQVVQKDATLSGDGTSANPLKIAHQGAQIGQVLKWNGTTWVPDDDNVATPGSGDNWGTQTVVADNTLDGNGTNLSPLRIAQQGAAAGQVLKWSGTTWVPADDAGGNNYSAGVGISITGAAPNFTISNTGDNDNDPTNEIQVLSLSGNTLSLSNGGGSVDLPPSNTYTAGVGISITGTAPNFTISNTGDNDNDPTNELQTLSLNGPVLSISGSGSVIYLDTLLNNAGIGLWTASGTNIYNANTGNVGVGTTTPARPLHVKGNQEALRIEGSEAGVGFANGNAASATITKSAGNFALTTLDSSDIVMATGAGKSFYLGGLTGNVGLGNISHPTARLRVSHANGFAGVMIENIGSGGQWDFRVNGLTGALELYNNFSAGISPVGVFQTNGLYVPSDKSLKKDIQSVAYVLERLARLRPVYYRYNGESGNARRSIGFLAQEVEELFPELVAHNPTPDGQVYLGLNYAGFSVLAVKAIQEQQEQLEELRKKNEQLEERLQALEKRLLSLERALSDR
jgi:hypothetical protein